MSFDVLKLPVQTRLKQLFYGWFPRSGIRRVVFFTLLCLKQAHEILSSSLFIHYRLKELNVMMLTLKNRNVRNVWKVNNMEKYKFNDIINKQMFEKEKFQCFILVLSISTRNFLSLCYV